MLVTTVTRFREPFFLHQPFAREAVETLYRTQALYPFLLYAFVIMPDHCHFLVHVPAPGTIARIMNAYKSGLTFDTGIPKMWQRRYHLRLVRDIGAARRYIHANPVRGGLTETAEEYPWSSASGKWDVTDINVL